MRTIKSSDEFFDLLDTIKGGCFVTIGYVTSANVELPIVKRKNPLTNRMKGYNDYSQFNREGSDDNIGALVKITSYNFNYRNRQSVHNEYFNRVKPEINKIRAEFGIDDVGTKDNYKSVMSYGANGQELYSGKNEKLFGNSYSPQNMAKAIRINSKIYAVNTNGNIVRELDSNEVKFKAKKDPSGVAALRKMGADENRIKQFIEKINSLNFAYKNFEANSILYIVATVNGEKIVYINNNLQRTVEEIDINPQDFIAIAKDKYKQDIQEMRNLMKQNAIRLNESQLHSIIRKSINRILEDYQLSLSNKGKEGFNNMMNVVKAQNELKTNGEVILHILIGNYETIDVSIRKENGGYMCYAKGFEKLCATPSDAMNTAMNYARDINNQ